MSPQSEVLLWSETLEASDSFEKWMSQLPPSLKNIPIIHLAIPGTHDSMTCGITRKSDIAPDAARVVKILARCLGPIVKPVVFNWCVTQHVTALGQLTAGIRYLDLRVALHKSSNSLQFVHGMYAQEVLQPLLDIRDFLKMNKEEVAILDLQHFYDFSQQHHVQFQEMLKRVFGAMICPIPTDGDLSVLTLNWMVKHGYQVILIYRDKTGAAVKEFWPSKSWPTPWPQTTSVNHLIKFLDMGLMKRPCNAGFVTQCVLTPTIRFVVQHMLSNLQKGCAIPCNYSLIPWLEMQKPGRNGVNVVIADFFDCDSQKFPYIKTVVRLNRKLIIGD